MEQCQKGLIGSKFNKIKHRNLFEYILSFLTFNDIFRSRSNSFFNNIFKNLFQSIVREIFKINPHLRKESEGHEMIKHLLPMIKYSRTLLYSNSGLLFKFHP